MTTLKKTIEVDPELAGLDITAAIEWLDRRLARYDHTNVDWFKIEPQSRYEWWTHNPPERTAPRARSFKSGHKSTAYLPKDLPNFPLDLRLGTGSKKNAKTRRGWDYTFTDVTIADANELTVLRVGFSVWAWLRRTKQEPGRLTNNGCRLNGISWLESWRTRDLPGMGRRAAIMATREKLAVEDG